ncbi:MAG TPA: hypothetical protein VFN24_10165 [Microbacterium sp.]|nr:hypothetical protein [Microbacterium sp.]
MRRASAGVEDCTGLLSAMSERIRVGRDVAAMIPTWPPHALPSQSTGSPMPSSSSTSIAASAQSAIV